MLQTLSIENYALIEKLDISFPKGLSIITGETGAGKSILLGGLSLILGQRADMAVLKDNTRNCVVEAVFAVDGYGLQPFFADNDLDYDPSTSIRRIISPNGKSRAFVNEIPVTLSVLKELGDRLIDIHSQHQNLLLSTSSFQTSVIDAQAGNAELLQAYQQAYKAYTAAAEALTGWQTKARQAKADYDYLLFQHNELSAVQLKAGEQQELEDELKQLTHAGDIKTALTKVNLLLSGDEFSTENLLREATHSMQKIASVLSPAQELAERLNSARIELRDINDEIESLNGKTEVAPERLDFVENRLNTIYSLQQKHHLNTVEELIGLQEELRSRLNSIENFDQTLAQLQKTHDLHFNMTDRLAGQLSTGRQQAAPGIEKHICDMLRDLGMPHALFRVVIGEADSYHAKGKNTVSFLFSANKEMPPQELTRVASGGEISRVMLCLKSLMARSSGLPTMIFDEIDTGVSGDIADKMGAIVHDLSQTIQVINITHLPQVASKGKAHFSVYKEENAAGATVTKVRMLSPDERVMAIARMLSGRNVSQAAVDNARELLQNT